MNVNRTRAMMEYRGFKYPTDKEAVVYEEIGESDYMKLLNAAFTEAHIYCIFFGVDYGSTEAQHEFEIYTRNMICSFYDAYERGDDIKRLVPFVLAECTEKEVFNRLRKKHTKDIATIVRENDGQ